MIDYLVWEDLSKEVTLKLRPRGIGANHAKGRGQHETETQRQQRLSIAGALGKGQTMGL